MRSSGALWTARGRDCTEDRVHSKTAPLVCPVAKKVAQVSCRSSFSWCLSNNSREEGCAFERAFASGHACSSSSSNTNTTKQTHHHASTKAAARPCASMRARTHMTAVRCMRYQLHGRGHALSPPASSLCVCAVQHAECSSSCPPAHPLSAQPPLPPSKRRRAPSSTPPASC